MFSSSIVFSCLQRHLGTVTAGILDKTGEVDSSLVSDGENPFADLDIEDTGQADLETPRVRCQLSDTTHYS